MEDQHAEPRSTSMQNTGPDVELLLSLSHPRKIHKKYPVLPWPLLNPDVSTFQRDGSGP